MEPWERLDIESDKAWRAFCLYKSLGTRRSIRRAAAAYYNVDENNGVSAARQRNFEAWSSRFRWVERCRAFDDYEEEQRQIIRREAIQKMEERHASIAVQTQAKALEALQLLQVADLDANAIIRYLVEATKLERLARGEVTERKELSGVNGQGVSISVSVDALEDKIRRLINPIIDEIDDDDPE